MVGIDAVVKGSGAWSTTRKEIPVDDAITHETYISQVRNIAVSRLSDVQVKTRLLAAKLVYGVGSVRNARGVCYFSAWNGEREVIEICAQHEESALQLAGTTIHEVGHALAGSNAGHGRAWKDACALLGLDAQAMGQAYAVEHFAPDIRDSILALARLNGKPTLGHGGFNGLPPTKGAGKCPMGQGTRGGKSRGVGSGSRLRLYVCACPVRVRVASDSFDATCNVCHTAFTRKERGEK